MGNPLCHFEFMTDDPAKTRAFYSTVFRWEFDDKSMPGYTLINTGSEEVCGGLMKRPAECPHVGLSVYFLVDDIEQTLKTVAAGGGRTLVPKTPIPNVGHFAVFADPDGIGVGLFQR